MRLILGIIVGVMIAMAFPEQANNAYEFVRDAINSAASYIADQTREPKFVLEIN